MGRNKVVPDHVLIELIDQFYHVKCCGDARGLQLPKIAAYIKENGYPKYAVESLRRNELARNHIKALQETEADVLQSVLFTYKTLDVETFLDTHKTQASLKKALTDLDGYYRMVVDVAVKAKQDYQKLALKYKDVSDELKVAREESTALLQSVSDLKKEVKKHREDNHVLRTTVEDYVYPGIANALLAKMGVLSNVDTDEVVNPDKIEEQIISAKTVVKKRSIVQSGSNVIQGLFDEFEGY